MKSWVKFRHKSLVGAAGWKSQTYSQFEIYCKSVTGESAAGFSPSNFLRMWRHPYPTIYRLERLERWRGEDLNSDLEVERCERRWGVAAREGSDISTEKGNCVATSRPTCHTEKYKLRGGGNTHTCKRNYCKRFSLESWHHIKVISEWLNTVKNIRRKKSKMLHCYSKTGV